MVRSPVIDVARISGSRLRSFFSGFDGGPVASGHVAERNIFTYLMYVY